MIDDSPNAGAEKFVAAKYSTGKVLILHNLSTLTIHFVSEAKFDIPKASNKRIKKKIL